MHLAHLKINQFSRFSLRPLLVLFLVSFGIIFWGGGFAFLGGGGSVTGRCWFRLFSLRVYTPLEVISDMSL